MALICSNVISEKLTTEISEKVLSVIKHAVSQSYGPFSSTTIMEGTSLDYKITKDGNTILRGIKFNDPIAITFLEMFREISDAQVEEVGDGSTTVIIAAYHFYDLMMKSSKELKQYRPKAKVDTVKLAVKNITKKIENYTTPITQENEDILKNIASVSLNNDIETGELIGEIYNKIGLSGFINVKLSNVNKTSYEKVNGFKIDGGYYDKIFINSEVEGVAECVLNKPLILMFDSYINENKYGNLITATMNYINENLNNPDFKYKSLLVLAPEYGSNVKRVINKIVMNYKNSKVKNNFNFIKYNLQDSHFADIYADLSAMVNSTIIKSSLDDENVPVLEGMSANEMQEAIKTFIDNYGGFANTTISKEKNTVFYDTEENKELISKILSDINAQLKYMKDNSIVDLKTEYSLKKRLSIIQNNLVTINVGGETESERISNKFLIDDAVAACKSALENGYVVGGDLTIIFAAKELREELEKKEILSDNEKLLIEIYKCIEGTFLLTYEEILLKSRFSQDKVEEIIKESIERKQIFDLVNEEFTSDKIINSAKTETEILKNMTNIVTLIITSNQYISNIPREESEITLSNR